MYSRRGAEERTLRELADELGLSRERVRQIEKQALSRLGERASEMGLA
jgi:DNA-directed RNA polymerase sigma subunit (sigma70/sigma32)